MENSSLPETLIRRAVAFGGAVYGSPIGAMLLRAELTPAEYRAALTFERAYRDYLAAIDARTLRTATLEYGSRGTPPSPDSPAGQSAARREASAKARYFTLVKIVQAKGPYAFRDFEAVVCAGVAPTWPMKVSVQAGCKALMRAKAKDARNDGRRRRS